jgi:L-lactate dehydrogenase
LSVGVLGVGGVGIATAGAIIQQGLAGRVTLYNRSADRARGEALDFLHALPLLPRTEVRGLGLDEITEEDVLVCTIGHHTKPGETRLDMLEANLEITAGIAEAVEHGGLPRVLIMVTNPLDVLTEYLTRRWAGRPVNVMGSGTCLDTLRFTELLARECGVHPRTVHAWVIGEHGDSAVFLHSSATIGAIPFPVYAAQRNLQATDEWREYIEREVRTAAYQVRELKGSAVHGIGLAVSGLVRCIGRESGTVIPVSVRVEDGLCASVPCALGPEGASEPLWPVMNDEERTAWEHSLKVLREATATLPF